jgi:hypothetical protein
LKVSSVTLMVLIQHLLVRGPWRAERGGVGGNRPGDQSFSESRKAWASSAAEQPEPAAVIAWR